MQTVTPKIIHSCIRRLLTEVLHPDPGDVEACCTLLATVGDALDCPRDENGRGCRYVDEYFERIDHIANDDKNNLSERLCCLLLDLITLRSKGWKAQKGSMLSRLLANKPEETFVLPKKKKKKKKKLGPSGELLSETCSESGVDSNPDSPQWGAPTAYGAALLVRMGGGKAGSDSSEAGSIDALPWPRQRSLGSESTDGPMSPWSPGSTTVDPLSLTYSDSGDNNSCSEGSQGSDGHRAASVPLNVDTKRRTGPKKVNTAKLDMIMAQVTLLNSAELKELQRRVTLEQTQRQYSDSALHSMAVAGANEEKKSLPVTTVGPPALSNGAPGPPADSIGCTPVLSRRGSQDAT